MHSTLKCVGKSVKMTAMLFKLESMSKKFKKNFKTILFRIFLNTFRSWNNYISLIKKSKQLFNIFLFLIFHRVQNPYLITNVFFSIVVIMQSAENAIGRKIKKKRILESQKIAVNSLKKRINVNSRESGKFRGYPHWSRASSVKTLV